MQTTWLWAKNKISEWVALDYRSLALLRIGIGLTIIADLIQRSMSFTAHYTDTGILPRADVLSLYQNKWFVSIHMISGLGIVEALLFITAGIFALMLIVGYRTTLTTIVSWFLLISLHDRNPMILQGGDVFFRVVLFWMMFLPTGKRYSLDRLFNRTAPPETNSFTGMASLGYIVQICALYFFTGILKTGTPWQDGSAVYYALSVDQLVTPVGEFIRGFPILTQTLTFATVYLETYGSLFFFSPIFTGLFRFIGILLFGFLQFGFNSSMRLGLFGIIAIISTLGLLPPFFWEKIIIPLKRKIARTAKTGLTIYYDAECTFCYKLSYILKRFLLLAPSTTLLPAYSNAHILELMTTNNSWVTVDRSGNTFLGWQGVITVFRYSPVFKPIAYILNLSLCKRIGSRLYHFIAIRRRQVCLPLPENKILTKKEYLLRSTREGVLLFFLVYILFWNIDTLSKTYLIGEKAKWIAWTLRLDQKFNMFAPTPLTEDGWYIFPAHLKNGSVVDIFTGGGDVVAKPLSYTKPKWVSYTYQDQRWQKFLMNIWIDKNKKYRLPYGKYICRTWNSAHTGEEQLLTFEMTFMLERTLPDFKTEPIKPTVIWKHSCF